MHIDMESDKYTPEEIRQAYQAGSAFVHTFLSALDKMYDRVEKQQSKDDVYNESWPYRQAFQNGQKNIITKIKSIVQNTGVLNHDQYR